MPLAQFSGRRVRKRSEPVFCEDEIAVGAHDPVWKQIRVVRCDNYLRVHHLLQYHNDALGELIMIEGVKLVNEH